MAKNNFNLFNNVSDMLRTFIDYDQTTVNKSKSNTIDFGQTIIQKNLTDKKEPRIQERTMSYGKLKNYNGTLGGNSGRRFIGIADYSKPVNQKSRGTRSFSDLFGTK